jgi:hypothetical protein
MYLDSEAGSRHGATNQVPLNSYSDCQKVFQEFILREIVYICQNPYGLKKERVTDLLYSILGNIFKYSTLISFFKKTINERMGVYYIFNASA